MLYVNATALNGQVLHEQPAADAFLCGSMGPCWAPDAVHLLVMPELAEPP